MRSRGCLCFRRSRTLPSTTYVAWADGSLTGRSTSASKGHPSREARLHCLRHPFPASPSIPPHFPLLIYGPVAFSGSVERKGLPWPVSPSPPFLTLPHQADSLLCPAPSTFSVFSSQSLRGVPSDCGLSPLFLHSKSTGLDVSRPGLWSCLFQQLPTDPGPP